MGFFQDLKQDLSQAVNDLESNDEELMLEDEVSDGMITSSGDLFGQTSDNDVPDLEAMLEQEIAAMTEQGADRHLTGESGDILHNLMDSAVTAEDSGALLGADKAEESVNELLDEMMAEADMQDISVETSENNKLPEADDMAASVIEADVETAVEYDGVNTGNIMENMTENIQNEAVTGADMTADIPLETEADIVAEAAGQTDADMEQLLNEVEQNITEPEYIENTAPSIEADYSEEFDSQKAAAADTAIITAGMSINGNISSTGNMDLIGSITGNIEIQGKLNVTGSITGNSSAAEIYAEAAQINGEVRSKGSVKIGQSSVIIGNIFATSAVIAGAVKGDIDVHGPVILDTSAIVMGNIKSKSVQINNGAVIEGMCSQCYADVSPASFFNEVKKNRKQ